MQMSVGKQKISIFSLARVGEYRFYNHRRHGHRKLNKKPRIYKVDKE